MIREFLESGKQEALKGVLNDENIEGDIFDFIERLVTAFAKKTGAAGAHVTSGPRTASTASDLHGAAKRLKSSSTPSDLQQLAKADTSTLSRLMADNITDSDVSHDDAAVHEAASQLAQELAKEFPSRAFRAKLRRHVSRHKHLYASQAGAGTAASLGAPSLSIDGDAVAQFLDTHDDFNLRHSKLGIFRAETELDEEIKSSVAKVQRVFKNNLTFKKTRALMDKGLHSAAQIACIGV
ncbi:hypothetical protein QBC39DRAFT_376998 [Podospora conica]|nr:hypothetical protein QBC39DRAFT_376998 [Schizothecium conicum]